MLCTESLFTSFVDPKIQIFKKSVWQNNILAVGYVYTEEWILSGMVLW